MTEIGPFLAASKQPVDPIGYQSIEPSAILIRTPIRKPTGILKDCVETLDLLPQLIDSRPLAMRIHDLSPHLFDLVAALNNGDAKHPLLGRGETALKKQRPP